MPDLTLSQHGHEHNFWYAAEPVGGGLPPMAVDQSPDALTDTQLSGASPLPHLIFAALSISFA
ncbi:hypothetical protein C4J97_4008 [Pseudomonas orientalis]|nr:hypothetical protein C4J97_4008 [Pseudomonas orientalis]